MLPMVANSVAICKNRADAMKGKSVVATVFISHASSCLRGWSGGYRVALTSPLSAHHPTAKIIVFISLDQMLAMYRRTPSNVLARSVPGSAF